MPETTCYDALKKTVSLLIVDDEPDLLYYFDELFSDHPLFNVKQAATSRAAEEIIHSCAPHLCLLDLGICDVDGDEFYLLRKYSHRMPFVIISATTDIERVFTATKLGAAGMIAKPPDVGSPGFWSKISDAFLERSILPALTDAFNPCLTECCRILQNDLPDNVSDWAGKAGITDAYLRRLCTETCSFSPKQLLFIYKFYKDAFRYYNEFNLSVINHTEPPPPRIDRYEYQQQENYFLQHRRVMEAIRDRNGGNGVRGKK
ncbi:MAG: response regulator [Chitinispirillaceae bacterium]|nr:response regulator [Chitinispirillaceae bacterium]